LKTKRNKHILKVYRKEDDSTVDDDNDCGDNNRSDGEEVYFDETLYPQCEKFSATTNGRAV
jgi:hypothetical protein